MTIHNTNETGVQFHEAQTLDAAKRAAAIIQEQEAPKTDGKLVETVFLDMGAGLVLAIDTAGRFTLAGLEQGGRPLLTLTPDETRTLYHFWVPICAHARQDRQASAVTERTEQQAEADVTEVRAQREDVRCGVRTVELAVVPNCQVNVLTFRPRVVTIDGTQFLQFKGADRWEGGYPAGWEHGYPVVEVTRMDAHNGLVLVATPEQVFLMTAEDYDKPIE